MFGDINMFMEYDNIVFGNVCFGYVKRWRSKVKEVLYFVEKNGGYWFFYYVYLILKIFESCVGFIDFRVWGLFK